MFHIINPINHTRSFREYSRYKDEPYVMAADVYTASSHVGRGGWSWYTGSAGWMYRAGLENILGIHKKGDTLVIDPHVPPKWRAYTVAYRYGATQYAIRVTNPDGVGGGVKRVLRRRCDDAGQLD